MPVHAPIVGLGPDGRRRVMLLRDEPRAVLAAIVDAPIGPITVASAHLRLFVPGWNLRQLAGVLKAAEPHAWAPLPDG